jgi:hypothetical protein
VFANGLYFGLAWTPHDAVRQAGIGAVRFGTEELLADEDIENCAAGVLIDAAETMHLLLREPQAGHFQEFGAEAFDDWLHVDLALGSGRTGGFRLYVRDQDKARRQKYQHLLSSAPPPQFNFFIDVR